MNDRYDERLKNIALKQPPAALRDRIMSEARVKMRAQRFWHRLAMAAAAAAVLLIVVNIIFCGLCAQNVAKQMKWPRAIQCMPPLSPAAQNIRERGHMITSDIDGNETIRPYKEPEILEPATMTPVNHVSLPSPESLMWRSQHISAAEMSGYVQDD